MICDRNCEHCQYDDCINDEMDMEDYRQADLRDELCMSKQELRKKEENHNRYMRRRQQQLAYSRSYYRAHKEEVAIYHKVYNAQHRERLNAQKREYEKRNRGMFGQKQRVLRIHRQELGLTQKEAAKLLGVSPSAVSQWERGIMPCKVEAVLRKLTQRSGTLGALTVVPDDAAV